MEFNSILTPLAVEPWSDQQNNTWSPSWNFIHHGRLGNCYVLSLYGDL